MTEKSYFWNGASHGDAQEAPYSAQLYSDLLSLVHTSKIPVVFDEYATADGFLVTPNAGMVIDIAAGKALIGGTYVSLAAGQKTIPNNTSGMDRIDRIVVRVDVANKTATIAIKNGMPAIVPIFPTLVQGTVYEMSLARIYVPNGLAAVTTSHIIDEREIMESSTNRFNYANENILPNSEFMASAGTGGSSPGTTYSPAYWTLTACECYTEDRFTQMIRGSAIRVECAGGAVQGISSRMVMTNQNTVPVTIRFLIEVLSGYVMADTIPIVSDTQGLIIPPTNGPVEVIIRTTFTAADPELDFFVGNYDSGVCFFKLGQVSVAYGAAGAGYGPTSEIIYFGNPVTQTGKTLTDNIVGPGIFDVSYDMQEDEISGGTSHALVHAAFRDSGSAGGASVVTIESLYSIDNTSLTNSVLRGTQAFIYIRQDSTILPEEPPRVGVSVQIQGTANLGISYIGIET